MAASAVTALLADLGSRQVSLRVSGSGLACSPRSALDDGLRKRIRAHKDELLGVLKRRARAEALVQRAISGAVLLRHLPKLLDWLADHCPEEFRAQEEQGLLLGEVWGRFELDDADEAELRKAARLWRNHLLEGVRHYAEKHLFLGSNPVWHFWTCYTRQGSVESGLSRFLRKHAESFDGEGTDG